MNRLAAQKHGKCQQEQSGRVVIPLMSELYIELPKPYQNKKINTRDQASFNPDYQLVKGLNDKKWQESDQKRQKVKNVSPNYVLQYSPRAKEAKSPTNRTESQIIQEWITGIFEKKKLLGIHWEEKLKSKQRSLMRTAFVCLKEENRSVGIGYLQTQSKHKPFFAKQNHLIVIGIEKLKEVVGKISLRSKRTVFSKILRFLAFGNSKTNSKMSEGLVRPSIEVSSPKGSMKDQIEIGQTPISSSPYAKPIHVLSPQKQIKTCGNITSQDFQQRTPVKQQEPVKNNGFVENEYSLTPASVKAQKKARKGDNFMAVDSRISRNSDRSKFNQQLLNSKSQPHTFAIGGIGGNFKYEFNQHNYIVVQPQSLQYPQRNNGNFQQSSSPSSPMQHQFQPNIKSFPQDPRKNNIQSVPLYFSPQIHQIRDIVPKRDANFVRPHSHNPFITNQNHSNSQKHQNIVEVENRKSRTISASANIKISFQSKHDIPTKDLIQKEFDYREQERAKQLAVHKLGTLQNKKMRQNYQLNSYGNQLISQDFMKAPQSPKSPTYIYSNPVSPKPLELYSKNSPINYISTNPASPSTPHAHSPRSFHHYLPEPTQQSRLKQANRKKPQRQKIVVTSALGKSRPF